MKSKKREDPECDSCSHPHSQHIRTSYADRGQPIEDTCIATARCQCDRFVMPKIRDYSSAAAFMDAIRSKLP